ncbi:MAG: hypothetical protein WDM94_09175 [Bauldia sp.]
MPFVHDDILDAALNILNNNADRIDICSQEPANYTQASSTYSLGVKDHGAAGSSFGAPADRTPTGRKVSSTAVTDGAVTATDEATHYAVSDTANSKLLVANDLDESQEVTNGNTFTLPSFDVGIPDAA